MKMSSGMSSRLLVLTICSMFSLASGCSGDKKPAGEEMEVSGEEAAPAPGESESMSEGEAPATAKKAKKKKGGAGSKKGKKGKKAKKTGA